MPLTSQPLGLSRHQPSSPALVLLQEASLGLYPAPVWMGCPACVHSPGPYNSGSPDPRPLCPQPGWADSPQVPSTEQMSLPTPLVTLPTTSKVLR